MSFYFLVVSLLNNAIFFINYCETVTNRKWNNQHVYALTFIFVSCSLTIEGLVGHVSPLK